MSGEKGQHYKERENKEFEMKLSSCVWKLNEQILSHALIVRGMSTHSLYRGLYRLMSTVLKIIIEVYVNCL